MLAQCRLAKSLIIGHAILPFAGDVPNLRSVDYRVQEHAGESHGQVIEHVLDERVVVPNIIPPRNNLPRIEDRLAPGFPLHGMLFGPVLFFAELSFVRVMKAGMRRSQPI